MYRRAQYIDTRSTTSTVITQYFFKKLSTVPFPTPRETALCRMSDADAVKALISACARDISGRHFSEHAVPGALFIRPAGNPIRAGDRTFFNDGTFEVHESTLVRLHKLDVGSEMAYAAMAYSSDFTIQGSSRRLDIYTLVLVLKKVDGVWKFALGQCSAHFGEVKPSRTFHSFCPDVTWPVFTDPLDVTGISFFSPQEKGSAKCDITTWTRPPKPKATAGVAAQGEGVTGPEAPETSVPETNVPGMEAPEAEAPETKAPETKAPEANIPQVEVVLQVEAPETKADES